MHPPPHWKGDRHTRCSKLGLFDCKRLARKGAIWNWVSGTPALRLGLNGIAPFESFWWPTAAESAGCPLCFKEYYVPEIEHNSGAYHTHARAHTNTSTPCNSDTGWMAADSVDSSVRGRRNCLTKWGPWGVEVIGVTLLFKENIKL